MTTRELCEKIIAKEPITDEMVQAAQRLLDNYTKKATSSERENERFKQIDMEVYGLLTNEPLTVVEICKEFNRYRRGDEYKSTSAITASLRRLVAEGMAQSIIQKMHSYYSKVD